VSQTSLFAAGPAELAFDAAPVSRIDRETVRRWHPELLAYARRRLRPGDAEDAVQATWAAALRGRHAGTGSFVGYLFGILRRKVIDHRRRDRRVATLLVEPTHEARTHEQLEARETLGAVERAWHHLAPKEARALELVVFEDAERDEAAPAMGVTREHLRVLVHRGRQKLARES
jgi:RNA polymerase sigma factor (sigma-70 family)